MRRANIYDKNEEKVETFRRRWREQRGEECSFDFAVNFMLDGIERIEETRTLTTTMKSEIEQGKSRKRLKTSSNFATDF